MNTKNGQLVGSLAVSWVGTVTNWASQAGSVFGALAALASLVASCYAIAIARRKLGRGQPQISQINADFRKRKRLGRFQPRMARVDADVGLGKFLQKVRKETKKIRKAARGVFGFLLVAAFLGQGCTHEAKRLNRARLVFEKHSAGLQEESRALTTGVVDALQLAPKSPETELARSLAVVDQEIEGLPLKRLPVVEALRGETNAVLEIDARVKEVESMRVENAALQEKLRAKEGELIAMGEKYEEARNRRISWWSKLSLGGLGLVGSAVALCVFCPVALPLIGRLLGWVVGKIPSLAGALGVVGKDAFDGLVKAVGATRAELKKSGSTDLKTLDTNLKIETDAAHKDLIDVRRIAVGV